jgi:hypothetical protein
MSPTWSSMLLTHPPQSRFRLARARSYAIGGHLPTDRVERHRPISPSATSRTAITFMIEVDVGALHCGRAVLRLVARTMRSLCIASASANAKRPAICVSAGHGPFPQAPPVGLEPTTLRLTAECSAN